MTNYRIFNALEVTGSTSNVTLPKAWGVMRGSAICSGSVTLEGNLTSNYSGTIAQSSNRSTIKLEHLIQGEPIPMYVRSITVTTGSAYLLA